MDNLDSELLGHFPQPDRGSTFSSGRVLKWVGVIAPIIVGVIWIGCGGGNSTSSTPPPTTPSPTVNPWPEFTAPSLGLSIPYPPNLKGSTKNDFQVGFGAASLPGDTDALSDIVVSVYSGDVDGEASKIRSTMDSVQQDTVNRISGVDVRSLVGTLKTDVFGWGGTTHGYLLFVSRERLIIVDYNAEDQTIRDASNQMVERLVSGNK